MTDAAEHERETEDQHAVRDHRADQGRLHDSDETLMQREQGDEQLWEIAERRLDRARDGRAESAAELLGGAPDQAREHRDCDRGDDERQHGRRTGEMDARCGTHQRSGKSELDEVAASHLHIIGP